MGSMADAMVDAKGHTRSQYIAAQKEDHDHDEAVVQVQLASILAHLPQEPAHIHCNAQHQLLMLQNILIVRYSRKKQAGKGCTKTYQKASSTPKAETQHL